MNARLTRNRDLERALEKYSQTARLDWDIRTCSWEDVFAEMDKAGVTYEKRAKGFRNLPRQGMRQLGDNVSDIGAWLDFIPNDHGLGILISGLKIVFVSQKLPPQKQLVIRRGLSGSHRISERSICDSLHAGRLRGDYLAKKRQYADPYDNWSDDDDY